MDKGGKGKKEEKDQESQEQGQDQGMSQETGDEQSIYHEIGKGEKNKEEETDPYYMEEIDKIR